MPSNKSSSNPLLVRAAANEDNTNSRARQEHDNNEASITGGTTAAGGNSYNHDNLRGSHQQEADANAAQEQNPNPRRRRRSTSRAAPPRRVRRQLEFDWINDEDFRHDFMNHVLMMRQTMRTIMRIQLCETIQNLSRGLQNAREYGNTEHVEMFSSMLDFFLSSDLVAMVPGVVCADEIFAGSSWQQSRVQSGHDDE